jgi:hypothetical protein
LAHLEQRTRWNARDSAATLIVTKARLGRRQSPGTSLTSAAAHECNRPCVVVAVDGADPIAIGRAFFDSLPRGAVVNVAGPRESEAPGIYAATHVLLTAILGIDVRREADPQRIARGADGAR